MEESGGKIAELDESSVGGVSGGGEQGWKRYRLEENMAIKSVGRVGVKPRVRR